MNERIRELFKKAGGKTSVRNLMSNPVQVVETNELWDGHIEQFAELIVRECGRFVDFRNQKYMPSTVTVTGDDLEELFGLKD